MGVKKKLRHLERTNEALRMNLRRERDALAAWRDAVTWWHIGINDVHNRQVRSAPAPLVTISPTGVFTVAADFAALTARLHSCTLLSPEGFTIKTRLFDNDIVMASSDSLRLAWDINFVDVNTRMKAEKQPLNYAVQGAALLPPVLTGR